MIKDIGFDWVYFFIAIPVVGSRLYDICIENNYLTDKNFRNHLHSKSIIKAPGVDPKKMQQIQYIFNLDANFVHNYNVRFGNYEVALIYFQKIVQKYPKHAFVYYALSECYKVSGKDINLAKQYASNFQKIINSDPEWRFYAEHFGLIDYE
jgi:tetratricopeptide (TPR) repeat protein